jgi:hypothetical protein
MLSSAYLDKELVQYEFDYQDLQLRERVVSDLVFLML